MNPVTPLRPPRARLIAAACGLGARDSRCGEGPQQLISGGLIERLAGRGVSVAWRTTLLPQRGRGRSRTRAIAEFCARLAESVRSTMDGGGLPVVLAGDHSSAIGTWSGAARALADRGPLGLVWIDAHLDSHTPGTSPSGMPHGMPLAALLGRGDGALGDWRGAALDSRHVCVVGARSFEPEEAALLAGLGVRVFSMRDILERGLAQVLADATAIVGDGTAGFGITIDLDVIDPHDAPGVGTPVPEGIPATGLVESLCSYAGDPRVVALEIAEYNPYLDALARTARVVEELLAAVLSPLPAQGSIELEKAHGASNYDPMPVVLVRGSGPYVWDANGRRYLDMMSAYSAVSHGHAHPRLVEALTRQAQSLAVTSRAYYNDRLPRFLERLCELTGQDRALPTNTGLEAVETAIKAARKWAYEVKGVPHDQAEIIACEGNFHGRSITIIAMSSEAPYRQGFGPFAPGFKTVRYGDAQALERAITPCTAAFLVEPIQGERGIVLPPPGYLAQCARICAERNVLFIADEIQTGLGRTGRLLACDHEGVKPDGLILGKALGGGLIPVSAFLAREDVMAVFRPGDHGSTFGGSPLAAAVGLEAIAVLLEERLAERAAELGPILQRGLASIASPLIREVRGRGLMIGVELDPVRASARAVAERLLAQGILSKDTHDTVLRFTPPLVIGGADIAWAIERVQRVFSELDRKSRKAA